MPPRKPRPLRGRRQDLEWMGEAACRGMDTRRFFPERGAMAVPESLARVCGACPVRQECLAFALRSSLEHGIWGGYNQDGRQRLRRQTRRRAS